MLQSGVVVEGLVHDVDGDLHGAPARPLHGEAEVRQGSLRVGLLPVQGVREGPAILESGHLFFLPVRRAWSRPMFLPGGAKRGGTLGLPTCRPRPDPKGWSTAFMATPEVWG